VVAPGVAVDFNGYKKLSAKPAHPDAAIGWELLAHSIGSSDPDFVRELVNRLPQSSWGPGIAAKELTFLLEFIQSVNRDEIEPVLGAQMAIVYRLMVTSSEGFTTKDTLAERQFYGAQCVKFARIFMQQAETMRRLRTGGEQRIAIQNNNVCVEVTHANAISKPGPEAIEVRTAVPLPLADSQRPPVPIIDEPAGVAVPARNRAKGKLTRG
jgi:hypothetical protein